MSFVYIYLPDNKIINWTLHGVWNTDRGSNIFYNIMSTSVKDIERDWREEYEIHTSYYNPSLKQKRPTNFSKHWVLGIASKKKSWSFFQMDTVIHLFLVSLEKRFCYSPKVYRAFLLDRQK
jgi:hypothetical protein